jgi:serine/threonine-protein kinase
VLAVCRADQQARFAKGQPFPAEEYLKLDARLDADVESAVELIYAEILERRKQGDEPEIVEYRRRFPRWADRLETQLAFRLALDGASSASPTPLAADLPADAAFDATPERPPHAYDVLSELGRGGMGVVYRVRDLHLHRDIAMKVLLDEHGGDDESRWRFLEEARITSQLQHPGIPPVHELGTRPDGRPFFTMKLIRGQTLHEMLAARADWADDRARYLTIFENICQTIAYAHSRRVIHRDLKPGNIMVGAFGEVQVMDWGLAKVLPATANAERQPTDPVSKTPSFPQKPACALSPSAATIIQSARDVSPEPSSQAGIVMGTIAYMAPEQALGDPARLDERCDVFGLGAILCEILTGAPPFAEGIPALLDGRGLRWALKRLRNCGADDDLIALGAACLAAAPAERIPNAAVLRDRLRDYQESVEARLKRAEWARAEAQAKVAEQRKRQRLAFGLAAAVLALTATCGIWAWRHQQQRTRDALEVAQALSDARRFQAEEKYDEAAATLRPLEGRLAVSAVDPSLAHEVVALLSDLDFVADLHRIRMKETEADPAGEYDFQRVVPLYRETFARHGLDVLDAEPSAIVARIRPRSMAPLLVASMWEWSQLTPDPRERDKLSAVLDLDSPAAESWDRRLRGAFVAKDLPAIRLVLQEAPAMEVPAVTRTSIGRLLQDLHALDDAVQWLSSAQIKYPGDFWINYELGNCYFRLREPRPEEALRYWTAASVLLPREPGAHHAVGSALVRLKRFPEAVQAFQRTLELRPSFAQTHNNLATVYMETGRWREALPCLRQAVAIQPDYGKAHTNLGETLQWLGQLDESAAILQRAVELLPNDAQPLCGLGRALSRMGRDAEAVAAFRQAIQVAPESADAYFLLGEHHLLAGEIADAISLLQSAVDRDPNAPYARVLLGFALRDSGQHDSAVAELEKTLALSPTDLPYRPKIQGQIHFNKRMMELQIRLPALLSKETPPKSAAERAGIARSLAAKGDFVSAARWYAEAFTIDPTLADRSDHRHAAARFAGLAALDTTLSSAERVERIDQAVGWLRAHLEVCARDLRGGDPEAVGAMQKVLHGWRRDAAFAALRDAQRLAELDDNRRRSCRELWNELDALLERSREVPK